MSTVNFYHTSGDTPASVDAVLPQLLEKMVSSGARALLVCPTESRTTRLDETLWTYSPTSFLPHGATSGHLPPHQPILITHAEEDAATHLSGRTPLVLAGAEAALTPILATNPEKALYMFSAAEHDVARARSLYKELKAQGHTLTYWQHTPQGWQKKGA